MIWFLSSFVSWIHKLLNSSSVNLFGSVVGLDNTDVCLLSDNIYYYGWIFIIWLFIG